MRARAHRAFAQHEIFVERAACSLNSSSRELVRCVQVSS